MADVMVTAFLADPVWGAYSFPDASTRRGLARPFWEWCVEAAVRFPWTFVTPGCEAAAVLIPPGEPEMTAEQEARFQALVTDLLGTAQAGVVLDAFARLDAAHPHDEPHHYLSLLGTHEDHRGRGLGMALLAETLETVYGRGRPPTTNPANDARYMRAGFEPHGRVELPNGRRVTTMWRPPR